MRDADRGCLGNAGAGDRSIFEFDRADPLATRLDHVLRPVRDLDSSVGMDGGDVARVEPLLVIGRIPIRLEIALDHPGAPALQAARRLAVPRLHIALVIDHAKLNSERHPSLPGDIFDLLLVAHLVPSVGRSAAGPDWRGFGHSPCMADIDTPLSKPADHRPWRGRAADRHLLQVREAFAGPLHMLDHRKPDSGNAGGMGDFLLLE